MERAGISQSDLARALGVTSQAVNQWTTGGTQPKGRNLQRLAEALDTPLAALLGVRTVQPYELSDHPPALIAVASDIEEIDVRAMGGNGAESPELDADGEHPVIARWSLPTEYLRSHTPSPRAVKIIRVVGDSMEPNYPAGDRVLVDTEHKVPSPPGVYVVWDGFGLVLKHVEVLAGRKPPLARLSSDNPAYAPYEVSVADLRVQGRVMGKWVWK